MRAYVLLIAIVGLAAIPPVPATGSCVGNDCFDGAIGHFGKDISASNAGATMESGEPAPCQMTGSLWYTLTPRSSGTLSVWLTGDWFSALAIYTGDTLGSLSLVTCQTTWMDPEGTPDSTWFPPDIRVPCVPDQPMRVQVGGMSGATGSFGLHAWGCAFDPTLPDAPRWCWAPQSSCWSSGKNNVTLRWIPPNWDGGQLTNIHSFNIYRADTCSGPFALLATNPAASWVQTYVDAGLEPGVPHCYRIHAVNDVGEGPASSLQTAAAWPVARPPTFLTVKPVADGALAVNWTASPDWNKVPAVTGYRVYGASTVDGPFLLLDVTAAATRVFVQGGLGRDATRYYRVSSVNPGGEGPMSAPFGATTPHPPGPPEDVGALPTLVTTAPAAFTVSWSAPQDAPWLEGYQIFRSANGEQIGSLVATVPATQTSWTGGGFSPLAPQYFTVKAFNVAGPGAPSAPGCATWPRATALGSC